MALADYKLCDKCFKKHYYDAPIEDNEYFESVVEDRLKSLCKECAVNHVVVIKERRKGTYDKNFTKEKP